MSTLFLIGNGFDLNCGMKTRYVDVYNGYVNIESSTECLKKFKKTIASDIDNWGDFEMAMARYAWNFGSEQEFLECSRDFTEYMETYLTEEARLFKERLSNDQVMNAVIAEMGQSISGFYEDISHNVSGLMERRNAGIVSNFEVISFNYTDAFDYIISKCASSWRSPRINVIHIHGVLGDGPVLGVDNIEQIKTKFRLTNKGKRGFVKPIFNVSYDEERVKTAQALINRSNTICLYGMSMGESDLSWRNALVEWLTNDENRHLFIYKYELAKNKYGTVQERMDTEEDEKINLFLKWGMDVESPIFERVHIPCGKNIFNVDGVIKRVNKELYDKKAREIEEEVERGRKFVEESLQEIAVTEESK